MLFKENKIKTYGLKKDAYISVSIKTTPKTTIVKNNKHKTKAIKKPQKPKIKKEKIRNKVDAVEEDISVDELFDNVWTKKIDTKIKKKKKTDIKRLAQMQKTVKIDKSKQKDLESLELSNTKTASKTSTAEEVNKYLAKIHSIVYDNFFPPANSEGYFVKAIIELSALGKVIDFRILNYSSHVGLNHEVDKIKNRIKNIIFPVNPENKNEKIIIILRAEDKE